MITVTLIQLDGHTAVGGGDATTQQYLAFYDGTNWVFPTI